MTRRQWAATVAVALVLYAALWLHADSQANRRIDADKAVVATNCHVFRLLHQPDPNC